MFLRDFDLYTIIITIPAILVGFTFHEYAHALVADRLGDKTPRFQGRLTLNPIAHIDIIGFIAILLAGFGWAKPVQTNPRAFKNYYKDDLKVSLAGVVANLIVAFTFSIFLGLFLKFAPMIPFSDKVLVVIKDIFLRVISINVMLSVFNLLPLPGLDGFHVFRDLFPGQYYKVADQIYRYQMVILIIFITTNVASHIIGPPISMIFRLLIKMVYIIRG